MCGGSSSEVRFGFKSGLFFGLGFAIAHKVVNDVMVPQYKVCGYQLERLKDTCHFCCYLLKTRNLKESGSCTMYVKCLDNYGRDISKCQLYMDKLHECCKRN